MVFCDTSRTNEAILAWIHLLGFDRWRHTKDTSPRAMVLIRRPRTFKGRGGRTQYWARQEAERRIGLLELCSPEMKQILSGFTSRPTSTLITRLGRGAHTALNVVPQ